ncbi:MAG TPA: nucleoside-diphosphate sugar epimerase/dehydratase [Steroidobacteraceae bacterium]|nr:nucleoside-diphosphate sugar epimerase/dehydratase [Steroidobacteraceae bacterium]
MLPFSLWMAIALRKGEAIDPARDTRVLFWAAVGGLALFSLFGLYRSVTRFIGVRVVARIAIAIVMCACGLALIDSADPDWHVRYSALPIFCAFALLLVAGSRVLARYLCLSSLKDSGRKRIAIYGAGQAGARTSRFLMGGPEFDVVAFIDDQPALHGRQINGVTVYPPADLPTLVITRRIDRVLIAMPSVSHRRRREVLADLEGLGVHVQSLPDLGDIISGKARIDEVRDVDAADLLGRDPVPPNPELFERCIRGKSVLVTGAGGSIGSELCRQIVRIGPKCLVLCERSELALYTLDRELREIIESEQLTLDLVPLLGNAGDRRHMAELLSAYSVQTVYHAAAYKHVPIVEHNVLAGLQNNVLSTWNAAHAAIEARVETFVLVSTDKAVNPTNVMGASKRLAELVLQGLQERSPETRFCMVRFGNVLGSSGSVVPLFREQIRRGGPVTVTHPQVVRYFMTIPEAAQLVIQAGSMAAGGDVFVLDMGPPVRIDDLARRMVSLMGLTVRDAEHPDGDIEIRYTGLRSAEKLFEELLIGNNVGGTQHLMIMRAMEKNLPWSQMREILERLNAAIDASDCRRAVAVLREAVPEYQPIETLRDHVWTSKASKGGAAAGGDSKVTALRAYRPHLEVVPSTGRPRPRQQQLEGLSPLPP